MTKDYKKLELVWKGKGEHVLQNSETGKWEFCGNEQLLPRPLIETEAFGDEKGSFFDPDKSNLLIHGENLFALQSLLPYYADKIKLIYIDPPFNTGNGFEAYNDNFEHSIWMSFLGERLDLAKKLLASNGVIFIHINMEEMFHLKVLADSIFGRNNFLQIITIKAESTASFRAINFCPVTVTEYILMYAKNRNSYDEPMQYVSTPYSEDYGYYIENYEKSLTRWKIISLDSVIYKRNSFKNWREAKEKWGPYWKEIRYSIKAQIASSEPEKVISLNTLQRPSQAIQHVIDQSEGNQLKIFKIDRKNLDPIFIYNGRTLAFFNKKLRSIDGELVPSDVLTNFWDDISYLGLGLEGRVDFKDGKKPEKLIKRILEIASERDDYVLDFFGGSATAAAVAHKMGRRWIAIENSRNTIRDKALPRLGNVINGKDQNGVSKTVNWKGGGGFRFLQVGAPLLVEDPETKLTILNPKYTNGPLTRAVCAIEGFLLTGDKILHGRNENHFAHITEEFVDSAYVYKVSKRLPNNTSLTIYALRARKNLRLPPKVRIKRMNVDLVKSYLK
ncbi:MAG: site-specific DNA-methyltransferase [Candidatus Parcubacteria bacterium]|nr:site-specific DNA-methyltransferase [Candidatus Parcubacteria bacterium]